MHACTSRAHGFPLPLPLALDGQDGVDTLYQLPHLTAAELGHITKGKAAAKGILDYLRVPDDAKKGLAELSPQQREDVLRVGQSVRHDCVCVRCVWWRRKGGGTNRPAALPPPCLTLRYAPLM